MNAYGIDRDSIPDAYDRLLAKRRWEKALMRFGVVLFIVGCWLVGGVVAYQVFTSQKAKAFYEWVDQR